MCTSESQRHEETSRERDGATRDMVSTNADTTRNTISTNEDMTRDTTRRLLASRAESLRGTCEDERTRGRERVCETECVSVFVCAKSESQEQNI